MNTAALVHQLDYQAHIDELTATLAQEAGEYFPDYLARIDRNMAAFNLSRLEALAMVIRLARLTGKIRQTAASVFDVDPALVGLDGRDG